MTKLQRREKIVALAALKNLNRAIYRYNKSKSHVFTSNSDPTYLEYEIIFRRITDKLKAQLGLPYRRRQS